MKSHLSVGFRQRDEKVSAPDLMVVSGKYKMVSEAHDAILKMVEIKDTMLDGLDSLEIDDNLVVLRGKSVILMAFPDAIKLLHRLGVCTIDKDDVVPPIEMAVASDPVQGVIMAQNAMAAVSDVIPQVQVAVSSEVAQGLAMPKITVSVASGATQGLVMPNITVSVASEVAQGVVMPKAAMSAVWGAIRSDAVEIRTRKVLASVLKTISGIEHLDDCPHGKELRQIEQGEIGAKGQNISGFWNLGDVGAAYLYDDSKNANRWAKGITTADASSLIKIPSGNPSVS